MKTVKENDSGYEITHKYDDSQAAKERVFKLAVAYVLKHADGESIYQSDSAQIEALELAAKLASALKYTKKYEGDE